MPWLWFVRFAPQRCTVCRVPTPVERASVRVDGKLARYYCAEHAADTLERGNDGAAVNVPLGAP